MQPVLGSNLHSSLQRYSLAICFILLSLFPSQAQQQKAGDESPNVVRLDMDNFYPFWEGYAIISKGTKSALIDTTGKIVLPYNLEYGPDVDAGTNSGFHDGLCLVKNYKTGLKGYINLQLKLVVPCIYDRADHFNNGYAYVAEPFKSNGMFFGHLNTKGERLKLKMLSYIDKQWQVSVSSVSGKQKYGYTDVFGKVVIPHSFDYARAFSDGLAAVMKNDEFGKPKWGFIDLKGNMVIKPQYSIPPGNFSEGFAIVVPVDQSEFLYAYIDKAGAIRLKITEAAYPQAKGLKYFRQKYTNSVNRAYDVGSEYGVSGEFKNGLAALNNPRGTARDLLIDTTGVLHVYPDFEGTYQYRDSEQPLTSKSTTSGGSSAFVCRLPFKNDVAVLWMVGHTHGVISIDNIVLIDPVFKSLKLKEDMKGLHMAEYNTKESTRAGYINDKGVFVILKAKPAQW